MNMQLLLSNKGVMFEPVTVGKVVWTTTRMGAPSKLEFSVLPDEGLDFTEGNPVRFAVDGMDLFFGFVFTKKRGKDKIISVTAYDQMRYLKNKDSYTYSDKTASQVLKMVADDFLLQTGEIEETEYVIPSRVESDAELFDVIYNALDLELMNCGRLFVLFDDFGKLTLKSLENMRVPLENMRVPLVLDEETGIDFDYSTSIDSDTYNVIKLAYKDAEGTKVVFSPSLIDGTTLTDNQRNWGVLQHFVKDENAEMTQGAAQAKADALLSLYNLKKRSLKISKAFGDIRVRAGTLPVVTLHLGDLEAMNYMLVEKAVHTFQMGNHQMDLTLRGGDITG